MLEEIAALERDLGRERKGGSREPGPIPMSVPSSPPTVSVLAAVEKALREREEALEHASREAADLRKHASKSRVLNASTAIEGLLAGANTIDGIVVASGRVEAGSMDELKRVADTLRAKLKRGVGVLGAAVDGKAALVCVVSDDLVATKQLQAGPIVSALARIVGGGGGGRPHLATAGGKDLEKLDDALRQAATVVGTFLSR
jgi:alanyl-tRNA synthetase